jgi:hypothetical protein
VKICVICAFPERCETKCLFKDNWPTEQQRVRWENEAHRERVRARAVESLEAALRTLQRGFG